MTRRRILPLRVLGSSATNRTPSGANDLPSASATRSHSSARRESLGSWPGWVTTKQRMTSPLTLCGNADRGRLGDGLVAGEDRLDLGRPQPLAGHLDRVVAAAVEEPVAVLVDRGPVAVDPDVRPSRPVGRQVALGVAPDPPRHRRPGLGADQLADALSQAAGRPGRRRRRPSPATGRPASTASAA